MHVQMAQREIGDGRTNNMYSIDFMDANVSEKKNIRYYLQGLPPRSFLKNKSRNDSIMRNYTNNLQQSHCVCFLGLDAFQRQLPVGHYLPNSIQTSKFHRND